MKIKQFEITKDDGSVVCFDTFDVADNLKFALTCNKEKYGIKNLELHIEKEGKAISLTEKEIENLIKFIKGYF